MTKVPAKYVAWSLWAAFVGVAVLILLASHLWVPELAVDPLAVDISFITAMVAMATTGTIVISRYPGNPVGWLLLFAALTAGAAAMAELYSQYAVHVRPGALPGGLLAAVVVMPLWFAFNGPLVLLGFLFPGGTFLSARWRWVSWGLIGVLAATAAAMLLRPELELRPPVENPIGIAGAEGILNVETAALVSIVPMWIASVISLVLRFLRSTGEERQQIKWFAYAVGIFTAYFAVSIADDVMGGPISPPLPGQWLDLMFGVFVLLLPASIAVAILKYRLYDIDLIINRTLLYVALTTSLAGIYVGTVIGLQAAFRATTGQESGVAVAASALLIVALFRPVRMQVQNVIDRRLYRRKYDAARTLVAFGERVREQADLATLNNELTRVVSDTLQPAHVTLWTRDAFGGLKATR